MDLDAFLAQLDHEALARAIADAELKSSGEIRVFVSRDPAADPVYAAQQHFDELGMQRTHARNGVLLFVAPQSRNFAIIGDIGVHRRCGDEFWQKVAEAMEQHFRAGRFTEALTHGIGEAGQLLSEHFPREADDVNELPDAIAHD